MTKKLIVITGPTASGKTKLTIDLAKLIDAEVVCADSRIVYKDFDIVSAKPTKSEQDGIIHHLIDIIDANTDFSAGDFAALASKIIDNTEKPIIISGGTWFYIKSLLDDFSLIKCPSNPKLREELEPLEPMLLWKKLESLDPIRAQEIHPNNKEKVIRSIEMCEFLGSAISQYQKEKNTNYNAVWFMPKISREELYQRINTRVDVMLEMGLYSEWQKNKEKYPDSKILKNTIGYKEFFEYPDDFNLAVEKIKQHTRNFAKRQLTYFRSRDDIKLVQSVKDIVTIT